LRTAIFLGLLFVANAINPASINNLSYNAVGFIAILIVGMMTMDFLDFLKENK
jgi:hypothetical protein